MKKTFLLFIAIVTTMTLSAQVFTEYFENAPTGTNLEGYNSWYVSFKASEANGVSPLIEEVSLFYEGYAGSEKGKVALLDSLVGKDSSTQRISTRVVTFGSDTLMTTAGGKMYAAFIVSILPNSYPSYRDFFTWEASTSSSFTRGRIFAKAFPGTSDLQLAVSKNSSSELAESEVISGGIETYHLLVLAYEAIEGDANDVISLYINPDPTKPEAEQAIKLVATDTQTDYIPGSSKIKINLRQRGIGALIGGIRVGTNWEQVLADAGSSVSVTGVSLDKETLSLDVGNSETLVATVTPADATDPSVTWSSDNEAVATVVNGLVTAVSVGEANITVSTTDGSFTDNCVVTVTQTTPGVQLFTEYFENATTGTNLEGYNEWYVSRKASEANGVSPLIEEVSLFYEGYAGSEKGKAALLDSLVGKESATQRISTRVVTFGSDTLVATVGGKMYAAFIVSILPNSYPSYRDFFTWEASTTSSFTRGRIFAKAFPGTSDLQLAVSKNSSSEFAESEVISGGIETYHLLVLAYEAVEGDANDVITLYINPDPTKPEAEQAIKLVATDTQSDYTPGTSKIKINLRQRGVGAYVGGIRVGTSWEQVLADAGSSISVTGVSLDKETLSLGVGNNETLVATVTPADATDPSVTWSSDNEAVATVVNGLVTGVSVGVANITVSTTDGFFTDNCAVTVTSSVGILNLKQKIAQVYPNPVSDILMIKLSDRNASSIEIFNVLGARVYMELTENRETLEIPLAGILTKGMYFVKINHSSGNQVEQIILQ